MLLQDSFSELLLKHCGIVSLAIPLQLLYNASLKLNTGEILLVLKQAIMSPLYKRGSRDSVALTSQAPSSVSFTSHLIKK